MKGHNLEKGNIFGKRLENRRVRIVGKKPLAMRWNYHVLVPKKSLATEVWYFLWIGVTMCGNQVLAPLVSRSLLMTTA
jgi:hypothetical protein